MALWPLLPLEMVPQGSLFSSWRSACPSRLLGQQTKLLSFSPRVFVLIPLLHVMKFLVSSKTFFQIASLTVGTLSCSACKLCSHPCWHLWTVTWSLDTGKGRSNHLQTFLPWLWGVLHRLQQHHLLLGKLLKSPNWSPSRLPSTP